MRLGQLKSNIEESELYLRDSNLTLFDINAIQYSDAPGKETINPSGLTSEEACQISKYSGMSDENQCFGLFGYLPLLDNNGLTAALCSQLIWYFIDGFYSRVNDKLENHQDFTKYRCDFNDHNNPILFLKSKYMSLLSSINDDLQQSQGSPGADSEPSIPPMNVSPKFIDLLTICFGSVQLRRYFI